MEFDNQIGRGRYTFNFIIGVITLMLIVAPRSADKWSIPLHGAPLGLCQSDLNIGVTVLVRLPVFYCHVNIKLGPVLR